MSILTSRDSSLGPTFQSFFTPLQSLLERSRKQWSCPVLPDDLWLVIGVQRCLGLFQSGRDLLQWIADRHDTDLHRSTFFESLQSTRRLGLLTEMLALQQTDLRRTQSDPFLHHTSLAAFDLYAGDGHFIAAASHDPVQAGTKHPTSHLYSIDLRTLAMNHLTVSDQAERKKEHDIRALKRLTARDADFLRQGAKKGRKVLYVWDRAGIDFRLWHQWKSQSGIYVLSREKANLRLEVMGHNPFRAASVESPTNQGVVADQIVGTSNGVQIRRVTYRAPETGEVYVYLTNLPVTVEPGLVALLYQSRWGIEKKFDEFKNKLGETQAWASSPVAKTIAARLLCLTHNLLLELEATLIREHGVINQAEKRRQTKRHQERDRKSKAAGHDGVPWLESKIKRMSQHSVKLIRWLKNHLHSPRPWQQAIARLTLIYQIS